MSAPPPQIFQWDGEHMVPRHARMADRRYVIGMDYLLAVIEERSTNSHRHYFASIHEAWLNLPEDIAERFPTEEHLRKYALIKCGFHDERSIVCASKAEAQRVAAFIQPMDTYALVIVSEAVVRVLTAKSQSGRAMDKKTFQESKTAVLDYLSELIGVERKQLEGNAA